MSKYSVWISIVVGALMAIFLIVLCATDKVEVVQSRTDQEYEQVENITCREKEDTDAPIGIKKEYMFTIDESMKCDTNLAFYTVHQYVEVYLDGQCVYSMKSSGSKRLGKTVGSNWVIVPIYREDAGREVRVEITPVYESFRDREVDFLMGSELAIYKDRLSKDLPQLILGFMAVFVGFIFICVAGYNIVKRHRGHGVAVLGLFSMMMGLWRLTDTRFTPFIFPDQSVLLFYISVTMLMLGMIPMLKWAEEYFSTKIRWILNLYCIVTALIALVQLMLQVTGICDLRETLYVTHIWIAAGAITTIAIAVYERRKYSRKSKLPYICVAGVIGDLAAFYIKGNSSGLLFSLLAFFLYIVVMGIATMFNYSEQEVLLAEQNRQLAEQDRALAEKERRLTQRRIAAMMSQIRTHFIFNVLTTISTYCKTDAQKADKALIRFSRYLRKNIRIIEEEGLIDFSMELEQLEDYVALEQMRFEDRIAFVEEIEVRDFQIPPLTIQPIVENAIKHGLLEQDKRGTIILRTEKKEKDILITVVDDGVGFEPQDSEKEDSVGIRNVRYRLEHMVDGRLVIESEQGEGTRVTIKIPVKETENAGDLCR